MGGNAKTGGEYSGGNGIGMFIGEATDGVDNMGGDRNIDGDSVTSIGGDGIGGDGRT